MSLHGKSSDDLAELYNVGEEIISLYQHLDETVEVITTEAISTRSKDLQNFLNVSLTPFEILSGNRNYIDVPGLGKPFPTVYIVSDPERGFVEAAISDDVVCVNVDEPWHAGKFTQYGWMDATNR